MDVQADAGGVQGPPSGGGGGDGDDSGVVHASGPVDCAAAEADVGGIVGVQRPPVERLTGRRWAPAPGDPSRAGPRAVQDEGLQMVGLPVVIVHGQHQ